MFRNRSVDLHQFSMVPKADIPRSAFNREFTHKTTFDAGYLVPVYVDEVLPGDTFNLQMTAFARLATPIFPLMDNLYLDSFFFFVPMRLVWENWKYFMGEQETPGVFGSYVVPTIQSPADGYAVNSLFDYFGLPTTGMLGAGNHIHHSVLPLRAYNLIYNEWFRDENLQDRATLTLGDSGDATVDFPLRRRGKRHDYFTGCLPFTQKGTAVSLPLGTTAPIAADGAMHLRNAANSAQTPIDMTAGTGALYGSGNAAISGVDLYYHSGLVADLSSATAATINQIRQAFQIQRLLERDARGGSRLTEIIRSHFGVISPDARLQRPEYLGGGSTPVAISPVAQTSGTSVTGSTTPLGTLSAVGTVVSRGHGFNSSFTEHGFIIGLVSVRADLTYQQGLRRMWSRSTRYDFYWPAFANLGEQAVLNKEIYIRGDANDDLPFGYQERWAELRHLPSMITGLFRSTASGTLDGWHLAQNFTSLPVLGTTFISETPPLSRVLAVGESANGKQLIFDSFFNVRSVRPLPMYSVPGMIDHF